MNLYDKTMTERILKVVGIFIAIQSIYATEKTIEKTTEGLELTPDQFKQLQTRLAYIDYAITICKVYLTKI